MATLTVSNSPSDYGSVFLPIQIDYAWANPNCTIYNSSGSLGIRVDIDFNGDIAIGDFVQVLNGSYLGSYKATALSTDASYLYIVTDGTFVSLDALSNLFNIDVRQTFELYGGYSSGAGATAKPYQKIADISVAINPTSALFEINLQSYLRSYFDVADPVVGQDFDISLQWQIKPTAGSLTAFKFAYYSAKTIDSQIVGANVPLGNVPLTFLNQNGAANIPTLFSVIEDTEKTVVNVITGVESITTVSTVVSLALITGQSVTLNIVKGAGTWGTMTLDPVVAWATITATVGDTVTIVFDTDTIGVGDYASVDYSDVDYLTSGLNSIVSNYSFDLLENAVSVGTIDVSVYPTLQVRRICADNVLNFAWLNQSGGWNSYAIECKYVKGYEIGRQQTYLTADNIQKRTELDDVYQNYSLTAELLSTFELDLLSSLKTSIQAYLYNDTSLAFDIPIIIDPSSFQTYGNRQRATERGASFSFKVATQENIQTQ